MSPWLMAVLALLAVECADGNSDHFVDRKRRHGHGNGANSGANGHAVHRYISLPADYCVHEAPSPHPLPVDFSINLRNVLDVNEREQSITLETSIRMYWKDPRVRIDPAAFANASAGAFVALNPKATAHFWTPDVFLDRAKAVREPTVLTRPASLRIYADGTLRYSSRLNYDMACPMDFHRFPVDKQLCEVNLESFGHTTDQLSFRWRKSESTVNPNISLAQFNLAVTFEDTYDTHYYDLRYPGVIVKVHLLREIGYHVVQTYIPSVIFVTVGWLSMIIPPESVPGRVTMSMTTLLTLTAMFGSVRQSVPKVSYVSLLDVWMLACIVFVFACVFEFILVTAMLRAGKKRAAEAVERCGRWAVPVAFAIFNMFYWGAVYTSLETAR